MSLYNIKLSSSCKRQVYSLGSQFVLIKADAELVRDAKELEAQIEDGSEHHRDKPKEAEQMLIVHRMTWQIEVCYISLASEVFVGRSLERLVR